MNSGLVAEQKSVKVLKVSGKASSALSGKIGDVFHSLLVSGPAQPGSYTDTTLTASSQCCAQSPQRQGLVVKLLL